MNFHITLVTQKESWLIFVSYFRKCKKHLRELIPLSPIRRKRSCEPRHFVGVLRKKLSTSTFERTCRLFRSTNLKASFVSFIQVYESCDFEHYLHYKPSCLKITKINSYTNADVKTKTGRAYFPVIWRYLSFLETFDTFANIKKILERIPIYWW